MNIVILYGDVLATAGADEQDALVQVAAISDALAALGHTAQPLALSLDTQAGINALRALAPAVVFNIIESVGGHGRLIHLGPAVLDVLRIPYTGARTEAMFLTSNKLLAKNLLHAAGVPTPPWFALPDLRRDVPIPAGRYIIKSVWEHASVGLSDTSVMAVASSAALRQALTERRGALGGEGFAEAYIAGREFNVSLLAGMDGPQVLPPAEICFDAYPDDKLKIVDYRAKWEEATFEYTHTIRRYDFPASDQALLTDLQALARRCWELFDLRGYARVDFRVDEAQQPWILEINTNPCISPDAGFMAAAARAGLTMPQVVASILDDVDRS